MLPIINCLKRLYWWLGNDKHIIISYVDGSTSFFLASDDAELDSFMDFVIEHNYEAIAIMIGSDEVLINFMNVTKIEIIEPFWS